MKWRTKMQTFEIKAELLNNAIMIDNSCNKYSKIKDFINNENHHYHEWIFLKTSDNIRIRMTTSLNSNYVLIYKDSKFSIMKDGKTLLEDVCLEEPIVHAPEQLYMSLYQYCKVGCKFCPLSISKDRVHFSLDTIYSDIDESINKKITSMGITTSVPYNLSLSDLEDEILFVVEKVRQRLPKIPIGVSTKCPTRRFLERLKKAGVSEVRLNLEVFNEELAKKIMPNKSINEIKESLLVAVQVFGRGKVSSNFIVGIGESNTDIENGIKWCCSNGIIPTIYPYDPIDLTIELDEKLDFHKPSSKRLIQLAKIHKKYLIENNLFSESLKTMCPACAASHIFPVRDMKF